MANDVFRRGLYPLNYPSIPVHVYRVSTAVDLYLGMPCFIDSNGEVAPLGVNTAGALKTRGVIVGFVDEDGGAPLETDPFLDVSDITAGRIMGAIVADDPNQEYIIQEDTGGTALVQADQGTVATMIFIANSGNTNTGWTTLELDRSTVVTTTAGQIQLLRPLKTTNSDGTANVPGNYCKWVVKLINHDRGFIEVAV